MRISEKGGKNKKKVLLRFWGNKGREKKEKQGCKHFLGKGEGREKNKVHQARVAGEKYTTGKTM